MAAKLHVAVTGPTGTLGFGTVPLLQDHPGIASIVGVARRPFDPTVHGWTKMRYRQGDVRDREGLVEAFEGCDVVIHLAFLVSGASSAATMRSTNVEGTLNAFRAAAAAGAKRFVYASSAAAYGFHADNPVPLTEAWPVRADDRFAYAAEKAELEHALVAEAEQHPRTQLYLLRPPIVLGPHAVGAKSFVPDRLESIASKLWQAIQASPVPLPLVAPGSPVQFVHEADVGDALVRCALGAGPPGAYNIAADDVLTGADVARALGFVALPVPTSVATAGARALAALPRPGFVPPAAGWVTALAQPAIVDCTKAKELLGWTPAHLSIDALRSSLS